MQTKGSEPLIRSFSSAAQFETWLAKQHAKSDHIWVQIFKKGSEKKTITYDEALDIALCYGWIDGQKKAYDDMSWIQRFTPRRPKSIWSSRNTKRAEELIAIKRMQTPGLKEVERAKQDGRWDAAYKGSSTMDVPEDFLKELKKDKKAYAFYKTLNKANTYAIAWRLQTAKKPETRARRMSVLLEMLAKEQRLH